MHTENKDNSVGAPTAASFLIHSQKGNDTNVFAYVFRTQK